MAITSNPPASVEADGSQVPITAGPHANAPSTKPFLIYSDTDITGSATGSDNVESYCALSTTEASRYQLNRPDHNQIFAFTLTTQNQTLPTYCLDKFRDGPYGNVPYQSASFETLFPDAAQRQKIMMAWILSNAYPSVSAAETFTLAGVNAQTAPVLDDNDAYAAVQVSLWVLLGQISPDEVQFLNCGGDTGLHPKSARLRAAVLELLQLAEAYADAASAPPPITGTSACRCGQAEIQCCNQSTLPVSANDPYLIFKGCPSEVRSLCGRLLVGPFSILSNMTGTLAITIDPICLCEKDFSASFTDFCGNPIPAPAVGEEFYLALRAPSGCLCFYVNASLPGAVMRILTMGSTSTALNYQPIGSAVDNYEVTLSATLCVCIAIPDGSCTDCKGCASQPGIDSNAFLGVCPGLVCLPLFACPPYPYYPSASACLPYSSYPLYPPTPSYPPCPSKPPYPPCPPKPPYPPCPPCPPKPPCKEDGCWVPLNCREMVCSSSAPKFEKGHR